MPFTIICWPFSDYSADTTTNAIKKIKWPENENQNKSSKKIQKQSDGTRIYKFKKNGRKKKEREQNEENNTFSLFHLSFINIFSFGFEIFYNLFCGCLL